MLYLAERGLVRRGSEAVPQQEEVSALGMEECSGRSRKVARLSRARRMRSGKMLIAGALTGHLCT